MDRWKRRGGESQRTEEQKRKDQRRERVRRKKMPARDKVAKSRNTVFPMVCGSKSRLAKAAGAEPCSQMRDEKLRAAVVRSRVPSQNVQNTPCSQHFWTFRCVSQGRRKGLCTLSKRANDASFLAFPNTMAGVGHLQRIWKDAFSKSGAGVQETCSSEMLGGQGADFLREVAVWSIRSSVSGGRQLCTQLSTIEGSLAELLRLWCCQLQKLRMSRRFASFLAFWRYQIQKLRKSRRMASFSELQIDR